MKKLIGLLLFLAFSNAHAGSACLNKEPNPSDVMRALELAQKASQALDQSGAQVALIARVGQDLSQYHLRYSHMAFVWRAHAGESWSVIHELNRCGTANSSLFDEGLGNLFLDGMYAYDTLIVIPSPETQARMAALLGDGAMLKFHDKRYNMLAYPFSTASQNSNQWLLETLSAALAHDARIDSRAQAQAWLKMAGYHPSTLEIPMLKRLGADFFRANISFNEQPFDRRMAGLIDTVTVESVVAFVQERDPAARQIALSLQ
jgi:hypothetical protein